MQNLPRQHKVHIQHRANVGRTWSGSSNNCPLSERGRDKNGFCEAKREQPLVCRTAKCQLFYTEQNLHPKYLLQEKPVNRDNYGTSIEQN